MSRIFSPGKLMLTSEYFAIDGALVLAVPTQPGQEFFYTEIKDGKSLVFWEASIQGKQWLKAVIDYQKWELLECNQSEAASFLLKVLRILQQLSKTKFQQTDTYVLSTNLQFPADYGLGSSSTLMNNLSEWAHVDPFVLNEKCLGGSGYDIAVAQEKSAVLFKNVSGKKIVEKVIYQPPFREELIFIHLNQKQNSREGIQLYRSKEKSVALTDFFSRLTLKILKTDDLEEFSQLMQLHEQKISTFLGLEPAAEKYFPGCPVFVKSLGAWGGDFVMSRVFPGYREWFSERGYLTLLSWNDLIN